LSLLALLSGGQQRQAVVINGEQWQKIRDRRGIEQRRISIVKDHPPAIIPDGNYRVILSR